MMIVVRTCDILHAWGKFISDTLQSPTRDAATASKNMLEDRLRKEYLASLGPWGAKITFASEEDLTTFLLQWS